MDGGVLTVEEVADLLRVSKQTVYRLVRKGAIPAQRVGRCLRFSRAAVLEWLNADIEGGQDDGS